ncbi:MAG: hypothetical protein LBC70_06990 [Chitinispirillales bacterium]|nr:hypothetical protein [Chitinispirillales bacterium]
MSTFWAASASFQKSFWADSDSSCAIRLFLLSMSKIPPQVIDSRFKLAEAGDVG